MPTRRHLEVDVLALLANNLPPKSEKPEQVPTEEKSSTQTLIFRDLMLGKMNPGVAAGYWALSLAPSLLEVLQCRSEGPHYSCPSRAMQLVRIILFCWRNGVKGKMDKREPRRRNTSLCCCKGT